MRDLFRLIGWAVVDLFRSRAALEAEIWTLRHQINVLRRTAPKRPSFSVFDRLVFAGLYQLFPNICDALTMRRRAELWTERVVRPSLFFGLAIPAVSD
jgi:hypothetical protein